MNRNSGGQKPKIVNLYSALVKKSGLRASVRANLDAIKNTDRQLILETDRQKIVDAIDLDAATQRQYPNSHRWDYIVCASNSLIGIEPHPAKDDQLRSIVEKKNHAQLVLTAELINGARVSRWIWVTRGRVKFSQNEKAQRYLAQNGIEFQGRLVRSL
jgi:hypothetical protein